MFSRSPPRLDNDLELFTFIIYRLFDAVGRENVKRDT
jgi:hypothetical protein